MNDTSINTESFIYGLPFNIALDEYYDTDKLKIDIDDCKYEIINEEMLKVDIDVLIEGTINLEEQEEKEENNLQPDVIIDAREAEKEEKKEKDTIKIIDNTNKETDLFKEIEEDGQKVFKEENKKVTSIFENIDSDDENYISYYVHIVRENENIEELSMKYNISLEDLKEYNNVDEITQNSKLIIPFINNDKTI